MPKGSGRRPLPTAVKRLRGNPGHRQLPQNEPQPQLGRPEMPPHLGAIAQDEWQSIVPQLELLGVLTRIDGKALAAYCHCYERWIEAEKEIAARGLIIEENVFSHRQGKKGPVTVLVGTRYKRNPAVSIANEALKLMRAFLIEFGMTPAARTRVRIEKPKEADPLEDFLSDKAAAHPTQ